MICLILSQWQWHRGQYTNSWGPSVLGGKILLFLSYSMGASLGLLVSFKSTFCPMISGPGNLCVTVTEVKRQIKPRGAHYSPGYISQPPTCKHHGVG